MTISVELTSYPVESGARVNDHRIINPIKWIMTGAVTDNPLQTQLTDFLGGAISNITNSSVVAGFGGLSAGFLASDTNGRSSAALQTLIELMMTGEPFNVDAIDIQLKNMVITRLSRGKDPETENGLIFVAELQELITLDRLPMLGQPQQYQLHDGDVSKSAIAGLIKKGQAAVKEAGAAVNKAANEVLGSVF